MAHQSGIDGRESQYGKQKKVATSSEITTHIRCITIVNELTKKKLSTTTPTKINVTPKIVIKSKCCLKQMILIALASTNPRPAHVE